MVFFFLVSIVILRLLPISFKFVNFSMHTTYERKRTNMIHKSISIWDQTGYTYDSRDGFTPTLDTYILNGNLKRPAVLICPGGGYSFTSPREAEPIAMQFNSAGFHAFVLY